MRYPKMRASPPPNWNQIAKNCAGTGKVGHFASLSVANADALDDASGKANPGMLLRGHALTVKFDGLESVPAI